MNELRLYRLSDEEAELVRIDPFFNPKKLSIEKGKHEGLVSRARVVCGCSFYLLLRKGICFNIIET